MTKNTMSMNSHICLRMICAVRMSPPRILRRVKLAEPDTSSSMACLAIASLSDLRCRLGWLLLRLRLCQLFWRVACLAGFSTVSFSAAFTIVFSWGCLPFSYFFSAILSLALRLLGFLSCSSASWHDHLVVDELEGCLDSSEEVLFYLSFRVARLHHVLHDAVFQRVVGDDR